MEKLTIAVVASRQKMDCLSFIRKRTNKSISTIKNSIEKNLPLLECDLFDTDSLIEIQDIVKQIITMNVEVSIMSYFDGQEEELSVNDFNDLVEDQLDTREQVQDGFEF